MEWILDACRRTAKSFSRFRLAEDGNYMVFVGIAAIPMVAAGGLGVDVARNYLAEAQLQAAIDAAAIAMGSADGTTPEIEELGRTFFYANFPVDYWAEPTNLTITVKRTDENDPTSRPESFEITATAQVDTLFFRALPGADSAAAGTHYDYVDIAASSTALTEVRGLEVVMVLDVTGSMYTNYAGGSGSPRRIEAMRDAALKMVNILFDDNPEPELLRVAIVPYNTTVNIGTDMHDYVNNTGLDASGLPTSPNPFGQTTWFGCVQARRGGNDMTDDFSAGQTDGTGEWEAYRWPIEPDRRLSGSTYNHCDDAGANNTTGDYSIYEDPLTNFEEDEADTWDNSAIPPTQIVGTRYYDRATFGPNKGCPGPLLPLTNQRADVWDYLQDVTVVDRNGTITATGLVWGWRVISPGPPFSTDSEGNPIAAYGDSDWEKVIIVLTDGDQLLTRQPDTSCTNARRVTNPIADQPPLYDLWSFDPLAERNMDGNTLTRGPNYRYSAYGYVDPSDSAPLGTGNIKTILEDRLGDTCTAIKNVEDPINGGPAIKIYSITFGNSISPGDTIATMMANCTTDPANNYFHAPDTSTLEAAFEEIARQLTSLRLTH